LTTSREQQHLNNSSWANVRTVFNTEMADLQQGFMGLYEDFTKDLIDPTVVLFRMLQTKHAQIARLARCPYYVFSFERFSRVDGSTFRHYSLRAML
jgi:hypothetical protein